MLVLLLLSKVFSVWHFRQRTITVYKIQPTIYLVVSVDVGELPLVAGDAHPLKLRPQVNELPSFLSLLVVLFGVVGERIELLIRYCTKEKETRGRALTKHRQTWTHCVFVNIYIYIYITYVCK